MVCVENGDTYGGMLYIEWLVWYDVTCVYCAPPISSLAGEERYAPIIKRLCIVKKIVNQNINLIYQRPLITSAQLMLKIEVALLWAAALKYGLIFLSKSTMHNPTYSKLITPWAPTYSKLITPWARPHQGHSSYHITRFIKPWLETATWVM